MSTGIPISCHPNAGLPNEMGEFDLGPAAMAEIVGEFADNGWVNILGGCCGTTPDHIRAIAERIEGKKPKQESTGPVWTRLCGPASDGDASRDPFHDDRGTNQCDRQSQVRQADPRTRTTKRPSRSHENRFRTVQRSSTSTLTMPCSTAWRR